MLSPPFRNPHAHPSPPPKQKKDLPTFVTLFRLYAASEALVVQREAFHFLPKGRLARELLLSSKDQKGEV